MNVLVEDAPEASIDPPGENVEVTSRREIEGDLPEPWIISRGDRAAAGLDRGWRA